MANIATNTVARYTRQFPARESFGSFISGALTAGQIFTQFVMPFSARIVAVTANADTAGTGAGNTVLDILQKNGAATAYTSIYVNSTANRPTLLATNTGEFTSLIPAAGQLQATLPQGCCVQMKCLSISTTGHAATMFYVTFGMP